MKILQGTDGYQNYRLGKIFPFNVEFVKAYKIFVFILIRLQLQNYVVLPKERVKYD